MKFWNLLVLLFGLGTLPGFATANPGEELLPPDEAYRITATASDSNMLEVHWDIADGYYMYRDRMRFSSDTPGIELGEPELPAGKIKDDEFFGKIAIFRDQVTARIKVTRGSDAPATLALKAVSQGCADIGVCYPPHTQRVQLELAPDPGAAATESSALAALTSISDRLGLDSSDDEFLDPDVAFRASISIGASCM